RWSKKSRRSRRIRYRGRQMRRHRRLAGSNRSVQQTADVARQRRSPRLRDFSVGDEVVTGSSQVMTDRAIWQPRLRVEPLIRSILEDDKREPEKRIAHLQRELEQAWCKAPRGMSTPSL